MQARTPEEKVDQLLTLRAKVEAELRATLAEINAEPARKRSRLVVPECGTESAYQRHRHYGEEADDECLAAHRLHNRIKYAQRVYGKAS